MAKAKAGETDRQILGISLPPDVAARVKVEAAKRNLSLRALFLEMWSAYEAQSKPVKTTKKS